MRRITTGGPDRPCAAGTGFANAGPADIARYRRARSLEIHFSRVIVDVETSGEASVNQFILSAVFSDVDVVGAADIEARWVDVDAAASPSGTTRDRASETVYPDGGNDKARAILVQSLTLFDGLERPRHQGPVHRRRPSP